MTFDAAAVKMLFLAPHNDDETLFGSFTLIRHKPHVIVCTKSKKQSLTIPSITYEMREQETARAMEVLGCTWHNWPTWDVQPQYDAEAMGCWLEAWSHVERVFAPAIESGGHPHHNLIGRVADQAFGDRVTHYMTYTAAGKSTSHREVEFEPAWIALKLQALGCYPSQIAHRELGCWPHFLRDQREFYEDEQLLERGDDQGA